MMEAAGKLVAEVLQYLEREEARLEALSRELEQLKKALVSGSVEKLEGAIGSFLEHSRQAHAFQSLRQGLAGRLPRDESGKIHWLELESKLDESARQALRRQRERVGRWLVQVQSQLRQVAVMAWFGQELYGRLLRAIFGVQEQAGQYGRQGTITETSLGHLLQIMG
ncbi:MAG: hypothetical protein NZM42_02435 [Gemmatales bacterium]|nr:hypothetical protein [Gemmatales bacterium]MDW8222653.1 hypothetical protein [Gemmatales bacterium]